MQGEVELKNALPYKHNNGGCSPELVENKAGVPVKLEMQQSCCDMYGMSVDQSMIVRMNSEIEEPIELIHHGSSNQRASPLVENQICSGDEDGNSRENQNRSPPTSCENSAMDEPRAKKRRKQSNPIRYQTTPVMPLLDSEECGAVVEDQSDEALDLQTKPVCRPSENQSGTFRCHHCNSWFETEDLLRNHIEEEHVQKVLERQLQQQSYNKTTSGNNKEGNTTEPAKEIPSKISDPAALQTALPDQARNSPSESSVQENREFKNPHFPFPPMPPPFIPFSRNEDSKPGNISVPLSMFPNPMTPFLFPVIPQGQNPPVSNGNSHSSQGVRIFNLEAYCELCNKEFCNKYFLKTHKANKHGIYSMESIVNSPYGSPFLSPGLSSPIPLPHLLQSPPSDPLPPRTGVINMESYCDICQKEFCNKYFLKKHRQKIHGIIESGPSTSPCVTPSMDAKSNSPVMTTASLGISTTSSGINERSVMFPDEGRDLPASKMEFPTIFNLQNQKLAVPNVSSSGSASVSSSSTIGPPVTTSATSTDIPLNVSLHGSSNENTVPHVFTPEKLREMGVINADAFCELCCKEFCNKYFLRTHKLNKHGINIPECSLSKPGTLPPNSSSQTSQSQGHMMTDKRDMNFEEGHLPEEILHESQGNAGMETGSDLSCECCNRPFSSLYLLKMHKFYTHNIPYVKDENKSKPNSPVGENGSHENKDNDPLKSNNNKPLSLPPPPLIQENLSTSLQEDVASQDLQKLQSMIRELNASAGSESNKISCNLCHLEFDNKYFLRAHMMNEHGVLPNEDGHVPGHNSVDSSVPSKVSESFDFQKVSFTSSSSVDSEAYCEICQKEFCSKYFLKTHKQNIHGLPLDMSSAPKKISLHDEVSQIKTIVSNTFSTSFPSQQTTGDVALPSSKIASQSCNSSPQAPIVTTTPTATNHIANITSLAASTSVQPPTSSASLTAHNVSVTHPSAISHSPSIIPVSSITLTPNISHTSLVNHSSSIPHTSNIVLPSNIAHTSSASHPPTNSHISTGMLSSPDKPRNLTGRNYCNICNKELCNKYFMKTHMLKMHGINLDSQPHEAARISTIGGVQCDICQKELCSKYFLKVHKQNTHGIFEEPTQVKENNNHPPAFLDKEQPQQGLDLSDPSGRYFNHYPEICPICSCRFKSIKWLRAHMMSDHGNILKENFPHNALPAPENNSVIDGNCICVLCGQGFADKVALHVHLIKDHHSATEELGVTNNSGIKTPSADSSGLMVQEQAQANGNVSPGSAPHQANQPRPHPKPHGGGGSRIYHCSFCVYSTRWLSNLYAHEKRHTGVNTEGEKKFVCRVCHRAYRYNHSLQRHFLSHRAAGLNVKDMAQPLVLSSSQHSHHLTPSLNRPWHSHNKAEGCLDKTMGHISQSLKVKRYRCSKCSKKFRTREMCLSHIHAVHSSKRGGLVLQKSIKPFRCRLCGFATRAWNVLKIHINKQHHNDMGPPKLLHQDGDKAADSSESVHTTQESPVPGTTATGGFLPGMPPPPPNSPHLPMTFAMPQNPPSAGSFIMQPFLLAQPECDGVTRNGTFVPSLVYLPVCQKVSQPMTVAFTLTPA